MQEHELDAFVAQVTESETASPTRDDEDACDAPRERESMPLAGELVFVASEALEERKAELCADGAVVVDVPPPPASMRGKLAEHLDDLVERALGVRGAPSPYLASWSAMPDEGCDAETRLADQLSRARKAGATGIAMILGSLDRLAAPALTPEDSASLRALADATHHASFVLLVDESNMSLGAYGDPVSLPSLLSPAKITISPVHVPVPVPVPDPTLDSDPDLDLDLARAEPVELVETHVDAPVAEIAPAPAPAPAPALAPALALALDLDLDETADISPPAVTEPELVAAPPEPDTKRDAARLRATIGVPVAGPSDFWRSWAIALSAARGPQPLVSFERLFIDSYMPLANAIAEGLDDPRAIRAHDEFRAGFERSYTDAFATFGATGRRPRLVMDAFDVAVKQARLHNARTTHVLVVDGMRHDLGCLVRDELAERAAGVASLTSESLLWSSLPTTTYRQLETLARGMEALRAPAVEETTDSLRGRSAETVRRLRVGSRELYKLDVVPSMLGALPDPSIGPGPAHVIAALDDIATSVADAILHHVETLPPRTLLLVLGDHGFTVDRRGRITHGGSSPEEVLVPCLAYLVGELH